MNAHKYAGPIEVGMRFVWEPGQPHARCEVEVVGFGSIDGERTIRARVSKAGPLSDLGAYSWNEESRFREAVVLAEERAGFEPTDAELVERFASWPRVPEGLRPGMLRYVDHGIRPGGFLCAVISNDLLDAVGCADAESLAAIGDIVRWFYNEAPGPCWKSPAALDAWVAQHEERRAKQRESAP